MIMAGDFRNGMTFEMDSQIYQVVEFQHVKPGKGAAFVRTKYKNIKTGAVMEKSFNPTEKFEPANIERKDMSYLYKDGDLYYFMDTETYDQVPIDEEILGETSEFLKEEMVCKVMFHNNSVIGVELPIFVDLEITECEPGVKGDTAQNATKLAIVETGAKVKVPLFVNQGERIKIDTRTGEYMERTK